MASPADGFSPALMLEVELTEPLPEVRDDGQHRRAWILGRLHTEPVGARIVPLPPGGLTPDQLGGLLWREFREPVGARFAAAGLAPPQALTGDGLSIDPATWPFLVRRGEILASAPFISVVVCTRNRPSQLQACLHYLDRQAYPRFEVVIVDNAPSSDASRMVVSAWQHEAAARQPGGVPCRYVLEPRGGLSWARNAGVAAAAGEIIAFLDDDEEPDQHWLAEIARGFGRGPGIGCVSGMILPARLDTPPQEWFENAGGHSKGRGFSPAVFSRHGPQSPLYPTPPFGAGGNMAFRRETLARIGGFDVAMGAGTPTCGGEDTLALSLALLAGYEIAYEPSAFVRHHHYRDVDGLARQLHGYGVGVTAFYAALLRHRPSVLPQLLALVPSAIGYLRRPAAEPEALREDIPAELRRQHRRAIAGGAVAYARSVRRQSRLGAPGSRR